MAVKDQRVMFALCRVCGATAPVGGLASHGAKACEQAASRRRRDVPKIDWRAVKDGAERVKLRGRMVYPAVVAAHQDGTLIL